MKRKSVIGILEVKNENNKKIENKCECCEYFYKTIYVIKLNDETLLKVCKSCKEHLKEGLKE